MQKSASQNTVKLSSKAIVGQVRDDIQVLTRAVDSWLSKADNYAPEYLLMVMVNCASRCKRGISRIRSLDASDVKADIIKLDKLLEQQKERFQEIFITDKDIIAPFFEHENGLGQRLSALYRQLDRIRTIVEDGILFENADWLQDDLHTAGEDFLVTFTDMASLVYDPPIILSDLDPYIRWTQSFNKLEEKFRRYFTLFSLYASSIQQQLLIREFGRKEFWWLHIALSDEPLLFPHISDAQLLAMGNFFLPTRHRSARSKDCPDLELIIAYAGDDNIGERNKNLVCSHVRHCNYCLQLLLDTRAAEAEAKGTKIKRKYTTATAPLEEMTDAQWADTLKKIPSWLLLREYLEPTTIEFPETIPPVQYTEELPLFLPTAQAARPAASGLPLYHDTGKGEVNLAKIVTVEHDDIISLYFVLSTIEVTLFDNERMHLVGRLEEFAPPDDARWFADWELSNGSIILPEEFHTSDNGFSIIFHFKGAHEKPEGELRLLVLVTRKS